MTDPIVTLDAVRVLLVKVTAGHLAEVCQREGLSRAEAVEALLSAGERDIDRCQWTEGRREQVKVAYAALIDVVALGK